MNDPEELSVVVRPGLATTALVYRAMHDPVGAVLILGHGAGAGQRSRWMVDLAHGLSALGLDIVTFNFLYSEQQRRVPDRRPLLDDCYRAVIDTVRRELGSVARALFIGGKSMGGRIATHIAADDHELSVQGLVLLGYPLHPPGRPTERRDAHLAAVRRPMLVVQGSRDTFGTPGELEPALTPLQPPATLFVVEGGDHSLKMSRNEARQTAVIDDVQRTIVEWIRPLAT